MSTDLIKRDPKLEAILSVFPLGRLSATLMKDAPKDTDANNISAIFQLIDLRGIYAMLQTQIPGMNVMIPIYLELLDEQKGFKIGWYGDHDPYNLGDAIVLDAETTLAGDDRSAKTLTVRTRTILGPSFLDKRLFRAIIQTVPIPVFDEAVKNFVRLMEPMPPCRCTRDYEMRDKDCELCGNVRYVPFDKLYDRWKPHCWFDMVTGIDWEDDEDKALRKSLRMS